MENNNVAVDEKQLSEDELYAKIQTEKLLKRKKTKKISTLIGVCFAFALAVVLIILGSVPVSLKPRCISDDFYRVNLVAGTTTSRNTAFEKGEEGFDTFKKVFNKAFSQPYLSSMFNGSMMYYDIDESYTNADTVLGSSGSLISSGTYYVYLQYTTPQKLTKQNGKKYSSLYSSQNWNGELEFSRAYIEVNSEGGVNQTKIYLVVNYPEYSSVGEYTGQSADKIVTITVKANTNKIYNEWENLLELKK